MEDREKTKDQLIREIEDLRSQSSSRTGEEKFRSLVEQLLVGVCIIQDDRFSYVNPKFEDIFGYAPGELLSLRSVLDLVAEEHYPVVSEELKSLQGEGNSFHTRLNCRRKDGTPIEVELHGTKTLYKGKPAIVGTLLDITERRKMEADLLKVQKLESLGILASRIAHEFNNILTAIIGNILLAKMYAKPELEVFDVLVEAEKASMRAENLTRQLLSFSKGGDLFKKVLSVRELIMDLAAINSKYPPVRYALSLPEDLWPVEANEGQLRQAVSNLLINAGQAMKEGGIISIRGENISADPGARHHRKEGDYIRISIEDQGPGIDETHIEKIFEPFFTTREKASGLGLASALSIIRNHGGYITVESRPGSGTTFYVYLPSARDKEVPLEETGNVLVLDRKKVLVMDDEEIVRTVVDRMLNQCGCLPEFARDGEEMIKLYREAIEKGEPFDAVIIDLIIASGMGGKEAIKKLLDIDPKARAIVSSGYSDDLIMADFGKFGFRGVLPKPYKLTELSRVLSEVIAVGK